MCHACAVMRHVFAVMCHRIATFCHFDFLKTLYRSGLSNKQAVMRVLFEWQTSFVFSSSSSVEQEVI